jgi:hypothetical protein
VSTAIPSNNQTFNSTDVDQKPVFLTVTSTDITNVPLSTSEPNLSAAAVVKPSSSNDKSALQSMNELAKFNKVHKAKRI